MTVELIGHNYNLGTHQLHRAWVACARALFASPGGLKLEEGMSVMVKVQLVSPSQVTEEKAELNICVSSLSTCIHHLVRHHSIRKCRCQFSAVSDRLMARSCNIGSQPVARNGSYTLVGGSLVGCRRRFSGFRCATRIKYLLFKSQD